jgi:hypothetical protein
MSHPTDLDRAHHAEFIRFACLNREQRLAALKAAQAVHGPHSPIYRNLANKHTWMLNQQSLREED